MLPWALKRCSRQAPGMPGIVAVTRHGREPCAAAQRPRGVSRSNNGSECTLRLVCQAPRLCSRACYMRSIEHQKRTRLCPRKTRRSFWLCWMRTRLTRNCMLLASKAASSDATAASVVCSRRRRCGSNEHVRSRALDPWQASAERSSGTKSSHCFMFGVRSTNMKNDNNMHIHIFLTLFCEFKKK